jgi:ATP-dependent Lhr-like helicase
VVLYDGDLVLYLERGGRSLLTFASFDDDRIASQAVGALRRLVVDGRLKRLQLERVDGMPVADAALRDRLGRLGFRAGYRGFVLAA